MPIRPSILPRRSAALLAQYRPMFSATISGQLYVQDTWDSSEAVASLDCYVGTPTGLELYNVFSSENPIPVQPR